MFWLFLMKIIIANIKCNQEKIYNLRITKTQKVYQSLSCFKRFYNLQISTNLTFFMTLERANNTQLIHYQLF